MALRSLTAALLKRRVLETVPLSCKQPSQLLCLRDFVSSASRRSEEASEGKPAVAENGASNPGGASGDASAEQKEGSREQSAAAQDGEAPKSSAGDDHVETEEEWEVVRRAVKMAHEAMNERFCEEPKKRMVINLAGEGRSGWQNWGYDEETSRFLWMYDLTAGKVPDNEQNALLSQDAKLLMGVMNNDGVPIADIASFFQVRQQRVLAILALQKLETDREESGQPMYLEYEQRMEGGWASKGDGTDGAVGYFDCIEACGSGERHVRLLPKAPHYERKVGKDGKVTHKNLEELEEQLAVKEEEQLVEEFADNLMYNLRLKGKSLKRNITKAHKPKRPKEGFSLLVVPKGKGEKPFVAEPGGKLRELNEDEQFMQHRQRIRRRRKLM